MRYSIASTSSLDVVLTLPRLRSRNRERVFRNLRVQTIGVDGHLSFQKSYVVSVCLVAILTSILMSSQLGNLI